MAKIYYVGGSASSTGILRCVLPGDQLSNLIRTQQFTFLGDAFPSNCKGDAPATIVEVAPDERPPSWAPGFYRAERPPLQFEETLRAVEQSATTERTGLNLCR